ncbi:hypothetical protein GSI_07350 [Ganoderma sinense ZZ0214-1]|uniref:Uncharacterized protein n=1 Tax=Ganoderma sinense ZZ0214-1 TaxID=1077348 RepID=A0A2G8SAM0_9APHY|nr:hypothetical protein GSI_07350 [Ganoderma sinense ZZ0214-1]
MSSDNSTSPHFHPINVNTLALGFLQATLHASTIGETMAQISLASLSFGILTILVVTSIYFLISRGAISQTNGKVLLLSTLLLYMSTITYMAGLIWWWSNRSYFVTKAFDGLFSPIFDISVSAWLDAINQQDWMLTIALGVNFVIGDAIVWWRACVIWQHKVVNCVGPLLILAAICCAITGMVSAPESIPNGYDLNMLIGANSKVALVLSFATNVLATCLIGYKTWEHRRLLKQHFAEGRTTSRVLKALALLTESGCIYCTILTVFLVYQADPTSLAGPNYNFETISNDFEYGCLVPVVAIYPATIIAIVALKQSPIDAGGLSQPRQARRHGSALATAEAGVASTVVFHHSTGVRSSAAAVETQGSSVAGTPALRTCRCMHEPASETSTSHEETKVGAGNPV